MPCEAKLRLKVVDRTLTPCGKPTMWIIRPIDIRAEYQATPRQYLDTPTKSCTQHVGVLIASMSIEFPTIFFEIRKAGMYD